MAMHVRDKLYSYQDIEFANQVVMTLSGTDQERNQGVASLTESQVGSFII